ncbi:MAG: hypothetical protein F4X19_02150 [Acidobacteria bacterium]|nr:hypothetical protein [Acidobacteriota bacterium]MYC80880.1 hypothetical protein [Acidobacteriota bacterium]
MDIATFVERGLRHALTDRDWAHIELQALDVEAQLLAIKSLIRRNLQADEDLNRRINDLRKQDSEGNGFWVDDIYQSFFQEAAHSMAAAGMLAPFIEAIFAAIFPCLPKEKKKKNQGIAKAITCLSKSKKLTHFFPDDYEKTIEALFLYRNKMFHNGFIWPENKRNEFQKRIKEGGWPQSWFQETTYKDSREKTEKPWILYMSTEFIEHCLWTIEQVLDGYGKSLGTT